VDIEWQVTYDYPDGWEAETLHQGVTYAAEIYRVGAGEHSPWRLEAWEYKRLLGPVGMAVLICSGHYPTLAAAIQSAEQAIRAQARNTPSA
jgi:hypothetical protein